MNSHSNRRRVIFLGERRISWQALQLINDPTFRDAFDLRVIVTNSDINDRLRAQYPSCAPRFISNEKRNANLIVDAIREEGVDLLLSVQHNWILSPAVLDAVGRQAFNLHNAKLPDYKGYNSIAHAILNGDPVFYSSLHWMFDKVDSGDIAYRGETPIEPTDTAVSLYIKTVDAAVGTFRSLLTDLRDGKPVPRIPLTGTGVIYPRDSLENLRDLTDLRDPDEYQRRVRALFFPPRNAAFIRTAGGIVWQVPDGAFPEVPKAWLAANQPT